MWKCPKCDRVFDRNGQSHSCHRVTLDQHFKNKEVARGIFEGLTDAIDREVGKCEVVPIPCCVHLFGQYDFLAALPKKDKLEIRFALDRALTDPRVSQAVRLSRTSFKNCLDLHSVQDIDKELVDWLRESYHLKGEPLEPSSA
jgi:hypothetical protein